MIDQKMETASKWRSLKVRDFQYEILARCSEKTGKPILKLGEEALTLFIDNVVPVYIDSAEKVRLRIQTKMGERRGRPRKITPQTSS